MTEGERVKKLIEDVERLQGIQKRCRPSSEEWQRASEQLQPLFRELARLQKAGVRTELGGG